MVIDAEQEREQYRRCEKGAEALCHFQFVAIDHYLILHRKERSDLDIRAHGTCVVRIKAVHVALQRSA